MTKLKVIISGYVQGVGFRYFIQRTAEKSLLTGHAKNMPNGRVEVMACGIRKYLDMLLEACRKGPSGARVDDVKVEWGEGRDIYLSFTIE